jgi:cbb3-type cytochrome oxidase subunit 1
MEMDSTASRSRDYLNVCIVALFVATWFPVGMMVLVWVLHVLHEVALPQDRLLAQGCHAF